MRKLILLLLFISLGCVDNEEKEKPIASPGKASGDSVKTSAAAPPEKAFLCFFSTINTARSENLRDSIILDLELTGEVVTGNLDWIPAEKDSRRGVIQATKNGDEVKGNYAFIQEGVQDTIFIEIQLQDTSAMVTTLSENGDELTFQVKRVDCL